WQPLNILFHMMQYPVWYPYRYSFIFSFFILLLAAIGLEKSKHANFPSFVLSLLLIAVISSVAVFFNKKINFVNSQQVRLFIFLSVSALLVYMVRSYMKHDVWAYFLLLIGLTSSALNAYISTNNFSYLT
ncbi:YfhO family protein, partial [Oenococcus oeni]